MNAPHNTTPTYSIGHQLTLEQLQMLARKAPTDRPAFQVAVGIVPEDTSKLELRDSDRNVVVVETVAWYDETNVKVTGVLVGLVDGGLIVAAVTGFVADHSGCLWNIDEV